MTEESNLLWDARFNHFFNYHHQPGEIGAEFEIEGKNLPASVTYWGMKTDNSLRGECAEYYFPQAMFRADAEAAIRHLYASFDGTRRIMKPSVRTSTHYHLNFQRCTVREMFGLMTVFTIIEPVLLTVCGSQRHGNLFCLSCYETGDLFEFTKALVKRLENEIPYEWWFKRKYSALNTDTMANFGSMEVRCFPLSTDVQDPLRWLNWCCNWKRMALEHKGSYIEFIDQAYNNPRAFIMEAMPGAPSALVASNKLQELVGVGLETAHELYMAYSPLEKMERRTRKPKTSQRRKVKIAPPEFTTPISDWTFAIPPVVNTTNFTQAQQAAQAFTTLDGHTHILQVGQPMEVQPMTAEEEFSEDFNDEDFEEE
jgi:hypothetical protein